MVMIKCERCGKLIEKKWTRERCIKCSNIRDRELAEQRRNNPEYHSMYMEKYKWKKRS